MQSLLITKNDLITYCGIAEGSDDSRINMAITQAHNQLRALLCRDYCNYLIDHNDAGDLAGVHLTFLNEYVKFYLSWMAYSKFVILGSQAQTESGFREHTDDHSQPVTDIRLNAIKKNAEEQVLYYKGEMMYYINTNIDSFSLFKTSDCYEKRIIKTFKISGAGRKRKEYYE